MGGAMIIEAILLVSYVMVFTWAPLNSNLYLRPFRGCLSGQNLKLYTLDGNKWYQN